MQKRAWEEDDPATPPQRRPRQQDWESDSSDGEGFPDHADSSSDSEAEAEPETMLLRTLLDLLFLRVLNARQFCVVLYWCGRCGLAALAQFGKPPGAESHHYQRHLESKLGVVFNDRGRFYNLNVPGKLKQTGGRHVNDMTMSAVWEEIDTDMRADPSSRMRVEEYLNDDLAPPSHPTHPVVLRHAPYLVALYDLFIDGVPYSLTDSVIGIWIIIAHTGKRHLVGAIRKKLICDCGCRGWCSFFPVFSFLHFVTGILANGIRPFCRHDELPWGPDEAIIASRGGEALLFPWAMGRIKGDWAEYAGTFGFPNWRDALRPCFCCLATVWNMHVRSMISIGNLPWRINGESDYFEACDRCEIDLVLSRPDHALLVPLLKFDEMKNGNRGLCLTADLVLQGIELQTGDRVEPSRQLPDVDAIRHISVFPASVLMWRCSRETLARHRCPVFDEHLGVAPHRSLTVDALHCLFLCAIKVTISYVVWFVLLYGVFGQIGSEDEQLSTATSAMKTHFFNWYRARHQQNPEETLTKPVDLSRKTFSDKENRTCKYKGSESWTLLLFLRFLLSTFIDRLPSDGPRILEMVSQRCSMVELLKRSPNRLSDEAINEWFGYYGRFFLLSDHLPELAIPKRHLWTHALDRLLDHGNPWNYSCWYDEHLNKVLKMATRNVSQATFEKSLLQRMRYILSGEAKKYEQSKWSRPKL